MQPYLFPYIGYFQLVNAVDKFIFYDDVNFIKRGWIARNNILVNDKPNLFSIPLEYVSQNSKINQVKIKKDNYQQWLSKFDKTIFQAYAKAPYYKDIEPIIVELLTKEYNYIGELSKASIKTICEFLDIESEVINSSEIYKNSDLKGQDRILDICITENADVYINPVGGKNLYDFDTFTKNGIKLHFLQATLIPYTQFGKDFVPWLSIIDILMFNSKEDIQKKLLPAYQII